MDVLREQDGVFQCEICKENRKERMKENEWTVGKKKYKKKTSKKGKRRKANWKEWVNKWKREK